MINIKNIIFCSFFLFCVCGLNASSNIKLDKIEINLESKSSLQRGAKVFFDYCQGCHSLKYIRYLDLAKGIGLTETKEKSFDVIIREFLMHSSNKLTDNSAVASSITKEIGVRWFGKVPSDLSLISRYRGKDWLYTYMRSFYKDTTRPFGVNNLTFPDVGMPHVLLKLQGTQTLKEVHASNNILDNMLELVDNGDLSKSEYNNLVKDLVTFLSYVGEPIQIERVSLGVKVLIYSFVLVLLLYFLKKEYWKDVK